MLKYVESIVFCWVGGPGPLGAHMAATLGAHMAVTLGAHMAATLGAHMAAT